MANMQVNKAQSGQKMGQELKSSGREALDNIRTIRNTAAAVATAGTAAMAAETLGVVTLPATIPTGLITLTAGSLALTTHIIVSIGEGLDHLINDSAQHKQLEAAEQ